MIDLPEDLDDTIARLRELHAAARTVNGGTPADHPSRQASVDLSAALWQLHTDRGWAFTDMDTDLMLRPGAIRARLYRHGYLTAPSVPTYKGAPATTSTRGPREKCRKGHPLAGDNVAPNGAHRQCRTCRDARKARYRVEVAA